MSKVAQLANLPYLASKAKNYLIPEPIHLVCTFINQGKMKKLQVSLLLNKVLS